MATVCNWCGKVTENISRHCSKSFYCKYPELTSEQIDVVTGLLMGDGCVHFGDTENTNPRVQVEMTNRAYLLELDRIFGELSNCVSVKRTAEENKNRSTPFEMGEKEEYNTTYIWTTVRHPRISNFKVWYTDEGKVFPDDIDLNSTVMKHWYCCDGNLDKEQMNITVCSQKKEKIVGLIEDSKFPLPDRWDEKEYRNRVNWKRVVWGRKKTREIQDKMGEPPDGFEYKWV